MKKRFYICLLLALGVLGLMSGCGKDFGERTEINGHKEESWAEEKAVKEEMVNRKESRDQNAIRITPTSEGRERVCLPVCTAGWHE